MHEYPNRSATPETVFTQDTLNRLAAKILSWRQAPGVFGGLHLHSCWGEASVLTRRYHGQTVSLEVSLIPVSITLFERTGDSFWYLLAGHLVENALFLQAPEGGFIHASNEFEPTYTCRETCPIAQGRPVNAMLEYAAWAHADPMITAGIEPALRSFWTYMASWWWRRGNAWRQPLDQDGWCGVTNQDFVIIEAMARFGDVYGDWSQYEQYGKPTLDTYLLPRMYHEPVGLFERGDQANFTERTAYYNVILSCLTAIHRLTGDNRLPNVVDNIRDHLFDACFIDEAGDAQLAWGALTDTDDKSRVFGWKEYPIVLPAYPELITHMLDHLAKFPDAERSTKVDQIERTLCSWVFGDGTLPAALKGADPLFDVVPNNCFEFFAFLVERLGDGVQSPTGSRVVSVKRTCREMVYRSNDRLWSIEKAGKRLFAGLRSEPSGVVIGDESLLGIDFSVLDHAEREEIVLS